jgi:hypothetical protein
VTSDFQARQKFAGAVAGFEFKKGDKGLGYYRTASSNNLHNIATDPTVKKKKKRALAQTKKVRLYDLSNSTFSKFVFSTCGSCLILSLTLAFPFTLGWSFMEQPEVKEPPVRKPALQFADMEFTSADGDGTHEDDDGILCHLFFFFVA